MAIHPDDLRQIRDNSTRITALEKRLDELDTLIRSLLKDIRKRGSLKT